MNVSVNASATPFQQPSGYGSHGYSTGKRPDRASFSAAVTDGGRACSQSHWPRKGTAVLLPPELREENGHGATRRSLDSPWKSPGLFGIQVWSGFEEYRPLHALLCARQSDGWGLGLMSESLSC